VSDLLFSTKEITVVKLSWEVCIFEFPRAFHNNSLCKIWGGGGGGGETECIMGNWKIENNVSLMRNAVQMYFAADHILLMLDCNHALVWKIADRSPELGHR